MADRDDPPVTLGQLQEWLAEVEAAQTRQATWTLLGLLGVLAVSMLLAGTANAETARVQHRAALLIRVCAVGAAQLPASQAAFCERAMPGFDLTRAALVSRAAAADSLERWAASGGGRPWVPPPTTTRYPDPPP